MKLNSWNITLFLASVVFLYTTEAAISAWTEPSASGKDVDAAATATVSESIANGASTGVSIQATGVGTVTYAIASQDTTGKLTIDGSSGELSLAVGTFDFETAPTYTLVVEGTDDNDNSVGTATVTLSITNANDAPVFASEQYAACLADGSTAGASVITVVATDVDGDTITYSITGGDTSSHFTIDGPTGLVSVNTAVTVDASALAGYTLTVTATDDGTGTLTDTTTIWIALASSGASAFAAGLLTLFVFLISFL